MPLPITINRFADITHRLTEKESISLLLAGRPVGVTVNHPNGLLPLVMMHAHQQAFHAGIKIDLGMEFLGSADDNETLFGVMARLRGDYMSAAQMTLGGLMYGSALKNMVRSLASVARQDQRYARTINSRESHTEVDVVGLHAIMTASYGTTLCLDELRDKMSDAQMSSGSSPSPEAVISAIDRPIMSGGSDEPSSYSNPFQV